MTYLDLIRSAEYKLDKGDITLGEYERMIEPLKQEIQPKIIRCKDCRYWHKDKYETYCEYFVVLVKGEKDGSGFCSDAERR